MTTDKQAALKARLLSLKKRLELYACHGIGKRYRVASGFYNGWNARDKDGVAWIENLSHAGLRFVGYADELARLDHKGWYADSFADMTYRGCVLQIPGKNGRARYLAAYADPYNSKAYRVDCSEIHIGDFYDDSYRDEDAKRDAARAADSFAAREAERARDYDEAFQMGGQWNDAREEIQNIRRELAALRREVKQARTLPGKHTARALMDHCARLRSDSRAAFERMQKLTDVNSYWQREFAAAFNDGAGRVVL